MQETVISPEMYLNLNVKRSQIFTLKGFTVGYHDRVCCPAKFKNSGKD